MQNPPDFLHDMPAPAPNADRLNDLRTMVAKARALELEKKNLAERTSQTNKALQELYYQTLPDFMSSAQVNSLELPADGNTQGVKAELKPYYKASISAEWPDDKRRAAFDWLERNGHGDLIKTVVMVAFTREDREKAKTLAANLRNGGFDPIVKEEVHHATLTAWLKEQVGTYKAEIPLETIGGAVGRVVILKGVE